MLPYCVSTGTALIELLHRKTQDPRNSPWIRALIYRRAQLEDALAWCSSPAICTGTFLGSFAAGNGTVISRTPL